MAQSGFQLSDEGRTITVLNDSGTTAITAGDVVYSAVNNDVLTGTAASARNAYAGGDIKVKSVLCATTGYKQPIGVALEDIPVDGYGAAAMEGIFIHAAKSDTEAGDPIRASPDGTTAANYVVTLTEGTTTVAKADIDQGRYKIGRALTGGSAEGKYIIWKLTL